MLTKDELMLTFKAIELMSKGVDISKYSFSEIKSSFVKRNGKIISVCNRNVPHWIAKITDDAKEALIIPSTYIVRKGREYFSKGSLDSDLKENTVVNAEILIQTIRLLHSNKICSFEKVPREILDINYAKQIEEDRKHFNRKEHQPEAFIKGLSKDSVKQFFYAITSIVYGNCGDKVIKRVLNAYEKNAEHFNIAGYEDYPVIDNRLFIPLSAADIFDLKSDLNKRGDFDFPKEWEGLKYIVISKNPYDYYFASYGSMIQSCYSLSSSHFGLFGVVPMSDMEGHYIIYGTKDEPHQFRLFAPGSGKISIPFMYFRAWGYVEEGSHKFLMDKIYHRIDPVSEKIVASLKKTLLKNLQLDTSFNGDLFTVYNSNEMLKYYRETGLRLYPDSLIINENNFGFKYDRGEKGFIGELSWRVLHPSYGCPVDVLSLIKQIDDKFSIEKPYEIIDGRLSNHNVCPVTNLPISTDESTHKFAKYYNSPVKDTAILTYIDGQVAVTALTSPFASPQWVVSKSKERLTQSSCYTRLYSRDEVSLKGLKDFIKEHIQKSIYDVILLRVIEGDKIEFIKYKKKGVF